MIGDERLREEESTLMPGQRGILIKVSIFAVVMLLVAAGLVVIFGQFRFSSTNTYHAVFENASRLKGGNDVRIAGIPVGNVKDIQLQPDNKVDVTFSVDKRYQMYTSTKAVIRYQNLVGDRFLEITSGPGELRKVPPGGTIQHTEPALDLDALLGGLRPVLKGLSGDKVNQISNAIIELLQGQGGALSDLLSSTGSFSQTLADRYQVISDVIHNLNTVLTTVDEKSAQFNQSIDQLQQLVTGLGAGPRPDRRRAAAARVRGVGSDRRAAKLPAPDPRGHREPAALGHRDGQPQGRDQRGHRAARRELLAAQRSWRLRRILQHLLLLGAHQDQRPVDRTPHRHDVRQRHPASAGRTA